MSIQIGIKFMSGKVSQTAFVSSKSNALGLGKVRVLPWRDFTWYDPEL